LHACLLGISNESLSQALNAIYARAAAMGAFTAIEFLSGKN
jgi:hypothetical protein